MTIQEYATHFIGKPYIWAGSGANGFDCSGFVIECLQAFGYLPKGDWTAESLYQKLKSHQADIRDSKLSLAFFSNGTKMTHVALMLDSSSYIEAGGGDSKCTSAENSTGMVRIRPVSWRKPSVIINL